jgi:hypothetical protein
LVDARVSPRESRAAGARVRRPAEGAISDSPQDPKCIGAQQCRVKK